MAIAGKVAPTYAGEWSESAAYQQHTYVTYNGDCYISIKPSTGIVPTNEEYWFLALKNVTQEQIDDIISGTTTVGNANNLGGKSASEYFHDLGFLSSSTTILNCIKNAINSGITNGYFLEAGSSDSATGSSGLIIFFKADGSSGIYIEEWDRQNGIIYRSKGISVNSISIEWTSPCATTADLANYLPLSGGTVRGDLTQSYDDNSNVERKIRNSVRTIRESVVYTGEYALDDVTNNKNIIRSLADGTNTFNGTATGNLPLDGGGTVNGSATSLILNNKNSNSDAWLGFRSGGVVLGFLGFNKNGTPQFSNDGLIFKTLLHTGNSAKVAIHSSAPSDTSALWVDTANKVIKAYIDGAWTQVS